MSSQLLVKLTKRKHGGNELWEGTAAIPGVKPTKLTKSKSQDTAFSSRTAVVNAANKLAEKLSFKGVRVDEPGVKKDAKASKSKASKTAKTTTKKSSSSASSPIGCTSGI